MEKAKQAYFDLYKVPIEKTVYRNDFGYKMPIKGQRETYRYVAELGVRSSRASLEVLPGKSPDELAHPSSFEIESLDMFAGDPEYQQCFLEITYAIDNYCNHLKDMGEYETFRGDRNFWKALDDINDPANVNAVQSTIGDPAPLDFSLRNGTIKLVKDKQGNVLDVLP